MSRNTSIEEGGQARPFGPVKCLMVEGEDGKYYPWYPEEDRALENTLSVDKNGVYQASKMGVYGWKSVNVNVPTTDGITGKDPQTGEEVHVYPDPETGELVKDVVPVEIRVITPPTNPYGVYVDGQTITKDGMVVKAYGANGDEMQVVPIGEITINPDRAVYDPSKDKPGEGTATGPEGMIPGDVPIKMKSGSRFTLPASGYYSQFVFEFNQTISMCHPKSTQPIVAGTNMPISFDYYGIRPGGEKGQVETYTLTGSYTHDGKTAVYGQNNLLFNLLPEQSDLNLSGADIPKAAWVMLYGTIDQKPAGSPQTITVSWPRPGDGAILETTFEITVGPRSGQGDD